MRAPISELPLPAVGHRVGMEPPGPEAKVPVLSPPSGPRDSWGGWEQHATHQPTAQPLSHLGSQVCSAHHLLCPSPAWAPDTASGVDAVSRVTPVLQMRKQETLPEATQLGLWCWS